MQFVSNDVTSWEAITRLLVSLIVQDVEAGVAQADLPERVLRFSGLEWRVKASSAPRGPGPNHWSDSPESVWVDDEDALHLRVRNDGDRWLSAEVVGPQLSEHGAVTFHLASPVDALDANAVLGLFLYEHDRSEIDIEVARFQGPEGPNGYFTVAGAPSHTFALTSPAAESCHRIAWRSGAVDFTTCVGTRCHSWSSRDARIPARVRHTIRMNLWLRHGVAPRDGRELEVIIRQVSTTTRTPPTMENCND